MREEERRDRKRFNFAKEKTLCCETPFTKVTAPTADDDEEKRRGRKGNNLIKGNFSVLPFSFASEGGQRKKSYSTVRKFFPPPVNQRKSPSKKETPVFSQILIGWLYVRAETDFPRTAGKVWVGRAPIVVRCVCPSVCEERRRSKRY